MGTGVEKANPMFGGNAFGTSEFFSSFFLCVLACLFLGLEVCWVQSRSCFVPTWRLVLLAQIGALDRLVWLDRAAWIGWPCWVRLACCGYGNGQHLAFGVGNAPVGVVDACAATVFGGSQMRPVRYYRDTLAYGRLLELKHSDASRDSTGELLRQGLEATHVVIGVARTVI